MSKATHILSAVDDAHNGITGGPIAIYGQADLDQRLAAATEAGVAVVVRPVDGDS